MMAVRPKNPSAEPPPPQPTADERRNGWTRDSLARYLREREWERALVLDPDGPLRRRGRPGPRTLGSHDPHDWPGYDPHRW